MQYPVCFFVFMLVQWVLFDPACSLVPHCQRAHPWSRTGHQRFSFKSTQPLFSTTTRGNSFLDSLKSFFPIGPSQEVDLSSNDDNNVAVQFFDFLNNGNIDQALGLLAVDDDETEHVIEWDDCNFYSTCVGRNAVERRLRLQSETSSAFQKQPIRVDRVAVDTTRNTIGLLFHREQQQQQSSNSIPNSRGCAMVELDGKRIRRISIVTEPVIRGGEAGLKILSKASSIIDITGNNPEDIQQTKQQSINRTIQAGSSSLVDVSPPEQYFDAWNRRDMMAAVNLFADDMKYEDTAFPEPFVGKNKLQEHLIRCSNAFPATFQIVIDNVAVDKAACAATVEWHFENGKGNVLPFTRGCSFYMLDSKGERIVEGIDFIEPAVIKPGGLTMFLDSLTIKLSQDPIRWIPLLSWVAYIYIVFFSDGILPGANALQLEARTWEEVINLSLNFFLVSPLLHLPFSPSVHPMLEGVFNLLLSWAAMFAGFLSDDRPRKPNLLPMLPMVAGMQFLTSAFLLPYLAVRSSEPLHNDADSSILVVQEDLSIVAQRLGENPVWGGLMGFVGTGSLLWFFLGRPTEYGADFAVRFASFLDLLSIDRVGSSFLVDLAIFALFQGWLVEDDLKRRGVNRGELQVLESVAKYIPFFGMAAYLILRPSLPERAATQEVKSTKSRG